MTLASPWMAVPLTSALLVAEEEANRAIYQLEQAKVKGTAIQGEAKVMEEYRELVEAGKQQFQKEMASIMPDVKLGEQQWKTDGGRAQHVHHPCLSQGVVLAARAG